MKEGQHVQQQSTLFWNKWLTIGGKRIRQCIHVKIRIGGIKDFHVVEENLGSSAQQPQEEGKTVRMHCHSTGGEVQVREVTEPPSSQGRRGGGREGGRVRRSKSETREGSCTLEAIRRVRSAEPLEAAPVLARPDEGHSPVGLVLQGVQHVRLVQVPGEAVHHPPFLDAVVLGQAAAQHIHDDAVGDCRQRTTRDRDSAVLATSPDPTGTCRRLRGPWASQMYLTMSRSGEESGFSGQDSGRPFQVPPWSW